MTQFHDVAEALLPRRYQEEIFSRAQERNVIAALDTGSGKTYISTLLIKWIAARDAGLGKIIVFLVPKVALVEQQGDFIARETPLRVSKCYGATAIDMTDRRRWRQEIESHDVLVMTAQIFLNILTHSHWTMDKVSLMVFDECHHTRKNHAYNGIMREYFQWPPEKRPKVFGMTASPIWNPRDAVESLATLERNLDAKVIAVREHVEELADHSPRPQEVLREYAASPIAYPHYTATHLWTRLGLDVLPPTIDIPVEKIRTRFEVTYHSLGPYGAELFLYHDIKHRLAQYVSQAEEHMEYMNTTHLDGVQPEGIKLPPELAHMEVVLQQFSDFFDNEEDPDTVPIRIDLKWCSPKVVLLSQLLFEYYKPDFQGIIFVEQRHVAACLSKMLPRIPPLQLYFKSAQLIGHGASSLQKSQVRGMALKSQQEAVKMFRDGECNLLVATSVAEEGLDFPACELVVRFDPIQHMVGYIQSRGRARQKAATFVVMVQEGQVSHVERYKAFSESEPQLRLVYQNREDLPKPVQDDELEEGEEREDPLDLAERERYVVPNTGAILTYNTSIGLLNHLCSLIPRDRFTPIHLPQYSGEFEATLQLPSSLPLPKEHLTFIGPPKRTKKEAKRAAAFMAVKRLHELGVFDDYLLPARSATGDNDDADGRPIGDVSHVPDMMDVVVRDPWTRGQKLWLHIVRLDGRPAAGLITGSALPAGDLVCAGYYVSTDEAQLVEFDDEDESDQRRQLEDFMRMGLWWCITGRGITLPLTCFLVPITHELAVDWNAIEFAVAHPFGIGDWSMVGEEHYGKLLIMSNKEHGRPLLLKRIRHDLTPLSVPPPGSREAAAKTYRDFYIAKYTRKGVPPEIPENGNCVEAVPFPRHTSTVYTLDGSSVPPNKIQTSNTHIYPMGICRWAPLSPEVYHAFRVLPELSHRLTDLYRARAIRAELGLPPIQDDLMIQALTLPSANAGFNNQRLETLGDSVLKLCTVVHLFNRFPHRHEGQLDILRRNSVSNRTLLARAKEVMLEQYLTSEPQTMRVWRFALSGEVDLSDPMPDRYVSRRFPKRSLQDCMEASLGAGFATGGIRMALQVGTALGLGFGGPLPWPARYERLPETPVPVMFHEIQEILGYEFKSGHLLIEAVTHPSFRSPTNSSYQRLEFMGDALIDLVVMRYLYNKFPTATSGQLSWARSRAVCAPALAHIAVNVLGLHKPLLINNIELSMAISKYVPILQETSEEEIIHSGWKHDPPKAISDVLESILGAVLVDTHWDFEKTAVIAENVLRGLLRVLSPNMPRDPVSELMVWIARQGCMKISFRKSQSQSTMKRNDCMSIIVHDFAVVGPIPAQNISLAKGLAAERARQVLEDPDSPYHLSKICDCKEDREASVAQDLPELDETKKLDDETEEGFAALARAALAEAEAPSSVLDDSQPGADDGEVVDDDGEDDHEERPEALAVLDHEDLMEVDHSEPCVNGHAPNGHINGHGDLLLTNGYHH